MQSERLAFDEGSVEARALALMHAHARGRGEVRAVPARLGRAGARRAGDNAEETVTEEACAVARQFGVLTSVCFEALLHPHDPRCRARLDALEGALSGGGLAALPVPPRAELN